jgi:hypothetical protein
MVLQYLTLKKGATILANGELRHTFILVAVFADGVPRREVLWEHPPGTPARIS